jgi:hypothetical protein
MEQNSTRTRQKYNGGDFLKKTGSFILLIPAMASDLHYRRVTQITIKVDCVEEAIRTIRLLDGQNLHSSLDIGQRGFNQAYFERRVSMAAYNTVMETLRSLGEVINESENTQYMGAEYRNLQTLLWSNNIEMQRLFALMSGASGLNILMAVDVNMTRAERERDSIRGRLNYIDNAVHHPYVNIHLTEVMPRPDPNTFTFWERMGSALSSSWNGFLTVLGHILVFFATASIPLIILAVIALMVFRIIRRSLKARHVRLSAYPQIDLDGSDVVLSNADVVHADIKKEGEEQ